MLISFSWQKIEVCYPVKAWRGDNVKSECSLYWSLLLQVIAPSVATWARILFLSINNIDVWSSLIFFPQHWFLILHNILLSPSISWKLSTSLPQSLASHISKNVMKKKINTLNYSLCGLTTLSHLTLILYNVFICCKALMAFSFKAKGWQMVIQLIMNLMIILGSDEDDDSYDFISKMAFTHARNAKRTTNYQPSGINLSLQFQLYLDCGDDKDVKVNSWSNQTRNKCFFPRNYSKFCFHYKKTYISIINLQITIQRWGLFEHEKCWLSKKQSGKKFCFNSFEEWVIEEKRESYTFCYPAIV